MSNENIEDSDTNIESKPTEINSLKDLIDQVSGKNISVSSTDKANAYAAPPIYPFLALVGQNELKLALTLSVINPNIGGVLLIGPRGTGKTTAIRGLANILPENTVSACYYGCLEEDINNYGLEGVCPECAKKFGEGVSLTKKEFVKLIELPLNATLDTVIGGLDERHLMHKKMRLKPGVLASADKNILYIDEVNLLSNEIINAILDAAATGHYIVRRGPVSATYNARFNLIGSMNPEEGNLRPQILDRFGLRLIVKGLNKSEERYAAYKNTVSFRNTPRQFIQEFAEETKIFQNEIQEAREIFTSVTVPEKVALYGINFVQALGIDSLRADQSLLEAAKAYAAADKRTEVNHEDLMEVAPMVLRLRKSDFMENYFEEQLKKEKIINELIKRQIWINDL